MPRDPKAHPESDDIAVRLHAEEYADAREEFPGLLVFRKRQAAARVEPGGSPPVPAAGLGPNPRQQHLFVLLVGESPTRGIVKKQFWNALEWIRATTSPARPELRIFGPTFSGSLSSLAQLLRCPQARASVQT